MSPSPAAPPQSASPATLAGNLTPPPSPDQSSGNGAGDQGMQLVIQKVRGIEMDLLDIGQQFPMTGKAVEEAVAATRSVLRSIIANPGAAEPVAPNIGG